MSTLTIWRKGGEIKDKGAGRIKALPYREKMEVIPMIRIATEADIPAMLAIYGPYVENTAYSFEYTVPTTEEFTHRFREYTRQLPWLVWEEGGQVLGYAYGSLPFTRSAYAWCGEVSIYLAPQIHGKGIGRKLYAVLEEIMWRQGYRVIYSLITTENEGSRIFHEKLGYTQTAVFPNCGFKFGRWLGIVWMEKRTNAAENPAFSPVSWRSIVEDDRKFIEILDTLSLS